MTKHSGAGGEDAPCPADGAAAEFAAQALRLRLLAQRKYAARMLVRLKQLAMDDKSGAVQVSAIRELLEQVLGRPMPAAAAGPTPDQDVWAEVAARGAKLEAKLDRIARLQAAPDSADGTG